MNSVRRFARGGVLLGLVLANVVATQPARGAEPAPIMKNQPLLAAIAADDAAQITRLVQADPALLSSRCDSLGRQPLHIAAHTNRGKAAEALFKAGADFYAADENGQLPLDIPPGGELNDAMKYLREINKQRNGFISDAAAGRLDKVQTALKADPELANSIDIGSGSTALLLACFKGHAEVAKALIEAGADVHKLEWSTGTDALYWSIDSDKPACTGVLLANGADARRLWDVKYGDLPMKMNALHYAAWKGRTTIVEMLLKHGSDANVRAASYAVFSPLHLAATDGHTEIVRLLLKHGADTRARDGRRGITAAEMAERAKHTEVARALAEHEAAGK